MEDFGIFLIKPDGVEKNIQKECEYAIKQHRMNIISQKKGIITKEDIKNYFYYQLPNYSEYMCSGLTIAFLLSSSNFDIDRELFYLKDIIRKKHAVSGRNLKNLVHASHCGTEYFVQRKLFFPNYEQGIYTSYADMMVKLPDYSIETINKVRMILESSHIEKICVCIPYQNFNLHTKYIRSFFCKENIFFFYSISIKVSKYLCELHCYCPTQYIAKNNNTIDEITNNRNILIALGEIRPIDFNIDIQNISSFSDYVELHNSKVAKIFLTVYDELKKKGINIAGLVVNTSNMSLVEAETRYEIMQQLGLTFIGGSDNWENFGLFGISETKFIDAIDVIS